MQFETPTRSENFRIDALIVAGWTGRDTAAVQHHIEELAAIGVPAPTTTPLFYRVGANLMCQSDRIEVLGTETSGEAEPLILTSNGQVWLGLGSDHTDRVLETVSVATSKQACPKPVAADLWPWSDVADRLDDLTLVSEVFEDGEWVIYQTGTLAAIMPLTDLMAAAAMPDNAAMMCGTLATIGGVRPADRFRARLHDPMSGRTIALNYTTISLPIVA
jgi:hypothetical protein